MDTFKRILKQYSIALIFLLGISFVMLLGTMAVTKFGNSMFDNIDNQEMAPRGEEIKL